jgi:arylsulfatase
MAFCGGAFKAAARRRKFPCTAHTNLPAMNYRSLLCFSLGCALLCEAFAKPAARPNIILIIADDQGYGDFSAHGNPLLRTPHLDAMRAAGASFSNFTVSPTCSPTRAALLTGRHEFQGGVTHTIFERERLAPDMVTFPELLRQSGYATAIFGKWHLGDEPAYQPDRRGFEEVFIHGGGGIGQTYAGSCGDVPGNTYFDPLVRHNGKFVRTSGYCTDVFFREAISWMGQRDEAKPFFIMLALNAAHVPLQVRSEDESLYAGKTPTPALAKFFGMIANIDDNIGRLRKALADAGRDKNTLIIYMTDNGGSIGVDFFNAGMRGRKGTPWRGGVRAASFWCWPGRIAPQENNLAVAHVDVFPTLMALAGDAPRPELAAQLEGRNLMPVLADNKAPWSERTLISHVGRWTRFTDPDESKFNGAAVRRGRWSLVSASGGKTAQWSLFDLQADPAESKDVGANHPEVVQQLSAEFDRWWAAVRPHMINENAIGPTVNPFKAAYWEQFGGEADAELLKLMDPYQTAIRAGG